MRKYLMILGTCFSAFAFLGGCVDQNKGMTLREAYSTRADKDVDRNEAARFFSARCNDKNHRDYVCWAIEYGSASMMNGNYDAACRELLAAQRAVIQQKDEVAEGFAAVSREDLKPFKGEPFERAMLCYYLGFVHYVRGDFNNARVFFAQAIEADNTTAENMAEYRNDLRLAHYWIGRSFMRLGKMDNARLAFSNATRRLRRSGQDREESKFAGSQVKARRKRMRLEAKSFKMASKGETPVFGAVDMTTSLSMTEMPAAMEGASAVSPVVLSADDAERFFTPDYQDEVNLIVMIELGIGPMKVVNEYGDYIYPVPYPDRQAMVYVDGHQAGQSFQLVDLYHQAATRGRSDKDNAQIGKAVTKAVLKQLPFVSVVAGYWDITPDYRYWHLLPGEVHVFAAKVKPGLHTIHIEAFDVNGYQLPRYGVTRYHVPVVSGQDNVYTFCVQREADNVYVEPEDD